MISHRVGRSGVVVAAAMAAFLSLPFWAVHVAADEFRQGDKVEVNDRGEWKSGTVVGPYLGGRFQVRLDKAPEMAANAPDGIKEQMRTKPYAADKIRLKRAAAKKSTPATATPEPVKTVDQPSSNDAAIRKWSDRSGKFSVDAKFYGLKGDRVALVKSDGKLLEVPLAKLSEVDVKYVRAQTEPVDENPFKDVGASVASINGGREMPNIAALDVSDDSSVAPAAAGNARKANWRDVRQVRPVTFKSWSFKPAARELKASESTAANAEVELGQIPGSEKFFEKVLGIYVADDARQAIVSREKGAVAMERPEYVELLDLTRSQSQGLTRMPARTKLMDVSPSEALVMYRSEGNGHGFGLKNTLTIAKLEGNELRTLSEWAPYDREDWEPRRDIDRAWFLGDGRVMTTNMHAESLVIWDWSTAKALMNIPVGRGMQLKMAVSPDRKLLAIGMKESIAIIDVSAGQHVATIPTGKEGIRQMAFRDDNTRLATISDEGAAVWDLTTGEKTQEMFSTNMRWSDDLNWAGEFLLVGNQHLFDVGRRVLLWEYQGLPSMGNASRMHAGRLWVVPSSHQAGSGRLMSMAVPNAAALEAALRLPSAEALLCVRPGDKVSIEVDIDPAVVLTDDIQQALLEKIQGNRPTGDEGKIVMLNPGGAQSDMIREALARSLEAAGLEVVERADLVVKAVCKPQPQQTIYINTDNRWPVRQEDEDIVERTITPHASFLEMALKGETLWKRGYVAEPHMTIWAKPGETLDQALERLTQPNLNVFTMAKFSAYLARPGKATPNGAYGVSQFTAGGLVDGKPGSGGAGGVFE